ncbi:MAG: Kdo hydroxylase family protein [Verrucomicrobia bacterium]|nr:Kdo hydroxylase family protein [Verrucomicrobiota bacterium]MBV9298789.1 Kdo hydroxylase family protein [Verrucomicrobiota bacterium]MBV9644423.1 Kdo hydroxylase family protein [Verrucomicrobiota bacterium]
MSHIEHVDLEPQHASLSANLQDRAIEALESGKILFLPRYRFVVTDEESAIFSPGIISNSKNVSYDPRTGVLSGTLASEQSTGLLRKMIVRFADFAESLVLQFAPSYKSGLIRARTSFRPVEIEGRVTSWRKDDTRLHVDSFPSSPTRGKRILRVFTNINPDGRSRLWRVGESFEQMAVRFLPSIRRSLPCSSAVLKLLGITKSRRTEYDHIMLHLHDRMKADNRYQAEVEQIQFEFPAGSTWLAFTDQVSHAAMRGQYQLEQTFLVAVANLRDETGSPLRVLERLTGRNLA